MQHSTDASPNPPRPSTSPRPLPVAPVPKSALVAVHQAALAWRASDALRPNGDHARIFSDNSTDFEPLDADADGDTDSDADADGDDDDDWTDMYSFSNYPGDLTDAHLRRAPRSTAKASRTHDQDDPNISFGSHDASLSIAEISTDTEDDTPHNVDPPLTCDTLARALRTENTGGRFVSVPHDVAQLVDVLQNRVRIKDDLLDEIPSDAAILNGIPLADVALEGGGAHPKSPAAYPIADALVAELS